MNNIRDESYYFHREEVIEDYMPSVLVHNGNDKIYLGLFKENYILREVYSF